MSDHATLRIVVVGHGGTLNSIYKTCTKLELNTRATFPMINASLNTINYRTGSFNLVSWGDTSHLKPGFGG